VFCHGPAAGSPCFGLSVRFLRLPVFAMASPFRPSSLRSPPPPRDPDSRVMRAGVRAPVRAFRGGAVRAPDCACARAREPNTGHTSPVCRNGAFPRRRRREGKRPARMPLPRLFPVYSSDAWPKCKASPQNFLRVSVMRLIIREKLPVFISRTTGFFEDLEHVYGRGEARPAGLHDLIALGHGRRRLGCPPP